MRDALAILEREGVIIRRHGAGTYVHYISRAQIRAEHAHEYAGLLRLAGFEPSIRLDDYSYVKLTEDQAAELDTEPGAAALVVCKTFLANGQPAIYCRDLVPQSLILAAFDETELAHPFFEFMRTRCHQESVQHLAELIPSVATDEIAGLLAIAPGTALLRVEEISYNALGEAVALHSTYYCDQFVRFSMLRKRM